MPDFPYGPVFSDGLVTISPYCLASIGAATGSLGSPASAAWPGANLAIFIPFRISRPILVLQMFSFQPGGAGGNIDVGIYDYVGTRLVSNGSVAKAGGIQIFNIADTYLGPGLFYMAIAQDGVQNEYRNALSIPLCKVVGMAQMAAAFALPATAVFATIAQAYLPVMGLTVRSVV